MLAAVVAGWASAGPVAAGTVIPADALLVASRATHYDLADLDADNLAVSLRLQPGSLRAGANIRWEVQVTNRTAHGVTLTFASSQLGDVALEQSGVERYRWSDGRMFAQVFDERYLAPGETWTFALEGFLELEPGRYEAIVTVACQPTPQPARVPVVADGGSAASVAT